MHHFIYPSKDTYISSKRGYDEKNFGIDELLQIGTSNVISHTKVDTKVYSYSDTQFNNYPVQYFTGIFTGSLYGVVQNLYGTLIGLNLLTASYFSGSVNGGAIAEYNGAISGSLNGLLTGSLSSSLWIEIFTGQLTGSNGCLYGTGSGTDTRYEPNWQNVLTKYVDRSLLTFDLSAISASIADGSIPQPKFHLKLKVCNEYELPIIYTIYALPVSQSWNMGNGYWSDGGSDNGVSWKWRNANDGTQWYGAYTSSTRPSIDFISNPTIATQSFAYGGGTWYTSVSASQVFAYESSDINMDVTEIVMAWISGSIPNEGFLLVSSDELVSTGSGYTLKFYSRDTNTIYSPYLDVMWMGNGRGGSSDSELVTGSLLTSSVLISTQNAGMNVSIQSGSTFSIAGGVRGIFSGSTFLTTTTGDIYYLSASGIVDGKGISGNIKGMPVIGNYDGILSADLFNVVGPCGNNFSASFVTASFTNGVFSGSQFTAYYTDDQKLENAILTGSWSQEALLGTSVYIPIPSGIEPFAYAYVQGQYVYGKALGTHVISGSNSASFYGQFIDGPLKGGYLNVQLSGSVFTSSYSYTSSVSFTSTGLTALDTSKPFAVIVQSVRPTYKAGDIAKIGIFGRKQAPLKTFGVSTQQEQYLVPEYLPTSSYYALKDNETGEIVLDFDSYTQISCEYPDGNYFVIDTTGLPQERYYRVLIRVEDENGNIYTTDCGKVFKITR